jgi:hypothetical protein
MIEIIYEGVSGKKLERRKSTLVELDIEELKRIDIDNIKYSLEISILKEGTTEKALPIVIKNREITYNIAGNSYHLWDDELENLLSSFGIDSYDIVESLENRKFSFEIQEQVA